MDIHNGVSGHVESVVLLGWKGSNTKYTYIDYEPEHHIAEGGKAAYREIKDYVQERHGLNVSSLYIAQVKEECGIKERGNYNIAKGEKSFVPVCPEDKKEAILDAFRHFGLI